MAVNLKNLITQNGKNLITNVLNNITNNSSTNVKSATVAQPNQYKTENPKYAQTKVSTPVQTPVSTPIKTTPVNTQYATPVNNTPAVNNQSRFIGFQNNYGVQNQSTQQAQNVINGNTAQQNIQTAVNNEKNKVSITIPTAKQQNNANAQTYTTQLKAVRDLQADMYKNNGPLNEQQLRTYYPEYSDKLNEIMDLQNNLRPIVRNGEYVDEAQIRDNYDNILHKQDIKSSKQLQKEATDLDNANKKIFNKANKVNQDLLSANGKQFASYMSQLSDIPRQLKQKYNFNSDATDSDIINYYLNNVPGAMDEYKKMVSLDLTSQDRARLGVPQNWLDYVNSFSTGISDAISSANQWYQGNVAQPLNDVPVVGAVAQTAGTALAGADKTLTNLGQLTNGEFNSMGEIASSGIKTLGGGMETAFGTAYLPATAGFNLLGQSEVGEKVLENTVGLVPRAITWTFENTPVLKDFYNSLDDEAKADLANELTIALFQGAGAIGKKYGLDIKAGVASDAVVNALQRGKYASKFQIFVEKGLADEKTGKFQKGAVSRILKEGGKEFESALKENLSRFDEVVKARQEMRNPKPVDNNNLTDKRTTGEKVKSEIKNTAEAVKEKVKQVNETVKEKYNEVTSGLKKTTQTQEQQGLQGFSKSGVTDNGLKQPNYTQENTEIKTNEQTNLINKAQTQLLQHENRMNPKSIQTFEEKFGESYGQYMYDRGFTKKGESNLKDMVTYQKDLMQIKEDALNKIDGEFNDVAVSDMLDVLQDFYTKTKDRKNLAIIENLQNQHNNGGLSMAEINKARKKFQYDIRTNFFKDGNSEKIQLANNVYLAVKDFLDKTAKENGLDSLDEINREIMKVQHIIGGVTYKMRGSSANNTLGLTDYITLASMVNNPVGLAIFLGKQALKTNAVMNPLLNIIVGGRGNAKNRITAEKMQGQLENIAKINDEKARNKALEQFYNTYIKPVKELSEYFDNSIEEFKRQFNESVEEGTLDNALPDKRNPADEGKNVITGKNQVTIEVDEQGNARRKGQISESDKRSEENKKEGYVKSEPEPKNIVTAKPKEEVKTKEEPKKPEVKKKKEVKPKNEVTTKQPVKEAPAEKTEGMVTVYDEKGKTKEVPVSEVTKRGVDLEGIDLKKINPTEVDKIIEKAEGGYKFYKDSKDGEFIQALDKNGDLVMSYGYGPEYAKLFKRIADKWNKEHGIAETKPAKEPKAETKQVQNSELKDIVGDDYYNWLEEQLEIINNSRKGNKEPLTLDDIDIGSDIYLDKFETLHREKLKSLQQELSDLNINQADTKLTPKQQKMLEQAKSEEERQGLLEKWRREYLEKNQMSDEDIAKVENIMNKAHELVEQREKYYNYILEWTKKKNAKNEVTSTKNGLTTKKPETATEFMDRLEKESEELRKAQQEDLFNMPETEDIEAIDNELTRRQQEDLKNMPETEDVESLDNELTAKKAEVTKEVISNPNKVYKTVSDLYNNGKKEITNANGDKIEIIEVMNTSVKKVYDVNIKPKFGAEGRFIVTKIGGEEASIRLSGTKFNVGQSMVNKLQRILNGENIRETLRSKASNEKLEEEKPLEVKPEDTVAGKIKRERPKDLITNPKRNPVREFTKDKENAEELNNMLNQEVKWTNSITEEDYKGTIGDLVQWAVDTERVRLDKLWDGKYGVVAFDEYGIGKLLEKGGNGRNSSDILKMPKEVGEYGEWLQNNPEYRAEVSRPMGIKDYIEERKGEEDFEKKGTKEFEEGEFSLLPEEESVYAEMSKPKNKIKRIAPNRVPRQQLTVQEGIENMYKGVKAISDYIDLSSRQYSLNADERARYNEAKKEAQRFLYHQTEGLGFKSTRSKQIQTLWKNIRTYNNYNEASKEASLKRTAELLYQDQVKKDIANGYMYPKEIIDKIPGALSAKEKYEAYIKGWNTSFSKVDERKDTSLRDTIGADLKRQDGKPTTQEFRDYIRTGLTRFGKALGVDVKRLNSDLGLIYIDLNHKNPFLRKGVAGMYTHATRSLSVNGAGEKYTFKDKDGNNVTNTVQTTLAHELTHALDHIVNWRLLPKDVKKNLDKKMNRIPEYMGSSYWHNPAEITARAVEEYVAVKEGVGDSYYDRGAYWNKEIFEKEVAPAIEKAFADKLGDYYKDPESIKYSIINGKSDLTTKSGKQAVGNKSGLNDNQINYVVDQLKKTGLAKDVKLVENVDEFYKELNDKGYLDDTRLQSVWHGSKASFDKFDSSHMGEGEGNQAHGWGHYVAVNEKTSRRYAELGKQESKVSYKGQGIEGILNSIKESPENQGIWQLYTELKYMADKGEPVNVEEIRDNIIKQWERDSEWARSVIKEVDEKEQAKKAEGKRLGKSDKEYRNNIKNLLDMGEKKIQKLKEVKADEWKIEKSSNNLYEVEIPDAKKANTPTGSNYLDEFEYLSYDAVKKIVDKLKENGIEGADRFVKYYDNGGTMKGKQMITNLQDILGPKKASQFLESLGYDGIHYFGGIDGEAYVIFNDDALNIKNHIQYLKDYRGDISGATTPDGTVYLIKDNLRGDTPTHEFSHLLRSYAKENNPELFNAINKIAKEAPKELKDYVERTYGELSEDAFLDEVFAWRQGKYSGIKSAERWYQRMWEAIKRAWNNIKAKFGDKYANLDVFKAWEKMGSEELMKQVDKVLKGGKEVKKELKNEITSKKSGISDNSEYTSSNKTRSQQGIAPGSSTSSLYFKDGNGDTAFKYNGVDIKVNKASHNDERGSLGKVDKSINSSKYRFNLPESQKKYLDNFNRLVDEAKDRRIDTDTEYKIGETEEGNDIILTKRQFRHLAKDHGELVPENLIYSLNNPDFTGKSRKYDGVGTFLKMIPDGNSFYTIGLKEDIKDGIKRYKVTTNYEDSSIDTTTAYLDKAQDLKKTRFEVAGNIHSKSFKNWFGDWENDPKNASKVVDYKGEPLKVYHGTADKFTIFDHNKDGKNTGNKGLYGNGFYFTDNLQTAREYGKMGVDLPFGDYGNIADWEKARFDKANLMEVYLDMKNPFYFKNIKNANQVRKLKEASGIRGLQWNDYLKEMRTLTDRQSEELARYLQNAGYDGIIYEGDNGTEYAVFNSNQIKSATDNVGTYDKNNPDIRYQKNGVTANGKNDITSK